MKTAPTFASSAASALRWNYAGSVSRMLLGLGVNIFLTRLLGPKPFGQLSVALIINSLAGLLGDIGVSSALIQKPNLDEGDIRYGFTVQVGVGLLLTCILFFTAPLWAHFFHDPGLLPVLQALSVIFFIQGLGLTSVALLKRSLKFRTLQICFISSYLIAYLGVGIPLAIRGAGVWSLVSAQLSQITIQTIALHINVRHSIRPLWDRKRSGLLTFGARVLGANLSCWGISNLDNTFVGRVDGPEALGLYGRAFLLAQLPGEALISTLQQVLLPAMSRVQSDKQKLARVYQGAVGAVALVLVPLFSAMAVVPYAIIVGLYGNRWLGAVAVFSPLALSMPVHAMMALTGPSLAAMGKTKVEMKVQAFGLIFAVAAYWSAVHYSLPLLGWSVFVVYILRFYLMTAAICKELELRWRKLVEVLFPAFALGSITTLTALLTKTVTSGLPPVYQLICVALADGVVLSLTMYIASRLFLGPIFSCIPELHSIVPVTLERFLPLRVALSSTPSVPLRGGVTAISASVAVPTVLRSPRSPSG